MRPIAFLPNRIICFNYIEKKDDVPERMMVILVPFKVSMGQEKTYVAWACSQARNCKAKCYYAIKAREDYVESNEPKWEEE